MVAILFICTGNAARSVMAGAALAELGGHHVMTSGTLVVEGQPASWRTRDALAAHGLGAGGHRSRQLGAAELDAADLVVGLAVEHVQWVRREHPAAAWKTATLKRLVRDYRGDIRAMGLESVELDPSWEDVEDPGGGDLPEFERCATDVVGLVGRLHAILS